MKLLPILYIVIPCYNEEEVLPITSKLFISKLLKLMESEIISNQSRIMFVNDGSSDETWNQICDLSKNEYCIGISQSRNRGHQSSVLAGLMESSKWCDAAITIDCDGQDDLNAIDEMLEKYTLGNEIVYGVRNNRETDTTFKRFTAESFYTVLRKMGVEVVFNHADYRLMSRKAIEALAEYKEVNLFLRGMVPLIGFKSDKVFYKREERLAGESHYPLKKMASLAIDGITSLSVKPIRIITGIGSVFSIVSFGGIFWSLVQKISGNTISGWTSMICIICLLGGLQLLALGVIGEYIGKIYLETKARPRYIISERTWK